MAVAGATPAGAAGEAWRNVNKTSRNHSEQATSLALLVGGAGFVAFSHHFNGGVSPEGNSWMYPVDKVTGSITPVGPESEDPVMRIQEEGL